MVGYGGSKASIKMKRPGRLIHPTRPEIETRMAIKRAPALDRIDVRILADLQRHGRSTMQELGAKVGLSPRASLERVRRLEAAGIITGYRAVIDIAHLSRPVNIF